MNDELNQVKIAKLGRLRCFLTQSNENDIVLYIYHCSSSMPLSACQLSYVFQNGTFSKAALAKCFFVAHTGIIVPHSNRMNCGYRLL